jgi:hypothetical protein
LVNDVLPTAYIIAAMLQHDKSSFRKVQVTQVTLKLIARTFIETQTSQTISNHHHHIIIVDFQLQLRFLPKLHESLQQGAPTDIASC